MDPVDWQSGKTNLECSKYMLDNQVNCDVNFKVGENEEIIKAHKYTLGMRSALFDRMFNGSFCESVKDPVIPDVTPAAFKMLLRYCYHECLDIEDDVALSVLYASTKYMLPLLEKAAQKKLIEIMSGTNVWDVYKYAINVGDTTLLDGCHTFFQGNITSVNEALQAEAFLNIPHKLLLDLLHINDKVDNAISLKGDAIDYVDSEVYIYVNNCGISISEIELFRACNAWAEAECLRQEFEITGANKRVVLGECLSLIRFPTMLYKDLMNVVYPTGILKQISKENYETDSQCQVDPPSRERLFVVTVHDPPTHAAERGTVHIESDVRVMLSRVWIRGTGPGTYRVTVRDETSEESWSMKYDTKHQGYCSNKIGGTYRLLHYIDVKHQLLEQCTKYSLTAERTKDIESPDWKLCTKWVVIGELSPYKEVKVTHDSEMRDCIYALTLYLV